MPSVGLLRTRRERSSFSFEICKGDTMKKKRCLYQIKTSEDGGNPWTCGAHLSEGYMFECPGEDSEIASDRKPAKLCVESCPDFKAV